MKRAVPDAAEEVEHAIQNMGEMKDVVPFIPC